MNTILFTHAVIASSDKRSPQFSFNFFCNHAEWKWFPQHCNTQTKFNLLLQICSMFLSVLYKLTFILHARIQKILPRGGGGSLGYFSLLGVEVEGITIFFVILLCKFLGNLWIDNPPPSCSQIYGCTLYLVLKWNWLIWV